MEEHVRHLEKVLNRLEEANLRLKPQKCNFAKTSIEYLGHTLMPDGVKPNSNKVKAVLEFLRPNLAKEVKSFIGLVNYYRRHLKGLAAIARHLKGLAAIARHLTALTRKDKSTGKFVTFSWSQECEAAFNQIKQLLTSALILRPPDLTKEF